MSNEKSTTTSSSNRIQDWVYVNIPLTWEQVGQLIQAIGKAPRVDQHLVYNNVTLDMTISLRSDLEFCPMLTLWFARYKVDEPKHKESNNGSKP